MSPQTQERFADLHTHTNFSDGTSSPKELVSQAKKNALSAIAITDHDTTEGITPALEEAKSNGIEVLPGVELTAEINATEVHILGYLINWQEAWFQEKLKEIAKVRVERIYEMVKRLKSLGIEIKAEDVFKMSGKGSVGRLHLARVMKDKGVVTSVAEAFAKYIGDRGPAYVGRFRLSPKEAIEIILKLSGIPVLAHPYNLGRDELIPSFMSMGLKGIEVYYPEHSPPVERHYENLAIKYGLLITGGSDFHGEAKPDVTLGSIKIPYSLVEELYKAKSNK
jgi:predicted metal-dependent phosphoesterase TrpH